jgi:hypothetical protein
MYPTVSFYWVTRESNPRIVFGGNSVLNKGLATNNWSVFCSGFHVDHNAGR